MRSAVVVPVPEAASAVDRWRERTCPDGPSTGVPAHITLVAPFVPAASLDRSTIASLARIVRGAASFDFTLGTTARFPGTLYLVPEPSAVFVRLTEAIVGAFPEHPPYEGAFAEIVPHLTVAQGDAAALDAAEADVGRLLPIAASAREALLLEEAEPGRWRGRARLPLGPAD